MYSHVNILDIKSTTTEVLKMKTVTILNETFSSKKALIDFAGDVTAKAKAVKEHSELFRSMGIGTHFGNDFTMTVKEMSASTNTNIKQLEELAMSLGATEEQISACKKKINRSNAVSFLENKPK